MVRGVPGDAADLDGSVRCRSRKLKILPKLKDGSFVRAFSDKLKLSNQLAQIPIYVVLNEDAPVLGAAHEALAAFQK
ncbi:MAG: hypothetical protein DMG96_07290 [Acidobacteria bacterium]|nr:MAG: hypothetical protein DMG96_07290 [Acidobacteriota bacterium]